MRRRCRSSAPSFALVAVAALVLAPALSSGCANGTSALNATSDASTSAGNGGGDMIDQPIPGTIPTSTDAGARTDASTPTGVDGGHGDGGGGGAEGGGDAEAGTSAEGGPGSGDCVTALNLAQYDFDDGPDGWTHGVSDGEGTDWPFDPWTQGTATTGPDCPEGDCFGAELTENYAQCQRGYLLSPTIDASACAGQDIQLTFQHTYHFWTDSMGTWFDGGIVEVSPDGGVNWHTLAGTFPGTVTIRGTYTDATGTTYSCDDGESSFGVDKKAGWTGESGGVETVNLTIPAALVTNQLVIRFSMGSGVSSSTDDPNASRTYTFSGWRIDDVGLGTLD